MAAFRLLGPVGAVVDGRAVALGRPQQRALLAWLALRANELVARERLVDLLWPDDPPEQAANTIQVYVSRLRKALGPDRILTCGPGYILAAARDDVDALLFEDLVADGRRAWQSGQLQRAQQLLGSALGLWRGDALADLDGAAVADERERLAEARISAVELRIDVDLAHGEHERLVDELARRVVEHPYRERLSAQLMLALYRSGRQAEALAAFRATAARLDEELGIEPGPQLRELHRAILRQDASLALARRSAAAASLPRPRTPLVGRAADVDAVAARLRAQPAVVTVTGIGGVGKTRVAVAAAAAVAPALRDGVVFVDLARVVHPAQVRDAVASALGVAGDAVLDELRDRELLLVLDNFEHVLAAAPFVGSLEGPVLVTSRVRLGLAAEYEYPLRPLQPADAVGVFVERAAAIDPDFALTDENAEEVAEVCRVVDGLPLALELAAATVKVFAPAEIAARLSRSIELPGAHTPDRPARQRSLRATMDWSYDLLGPAERQLFARLGVFRAGCTLDALEAVCTSTLDALNALLDHGLVLREHEAGAQPRFRMLGVVREYALERLDDTGVAERHARYYHGLATRLGGQLVGPAAETAAAGLRDEHDNVLAALEWFVAHDVDAGFELVAATRVYWDTARRGRDVRDWLDRALSRSPERASRAYVDALIVHGRQLVVAGEYAGAERTLQRSAEIAEQIDARASVALARVYLAWLRSLHGDDAGIAALATAAVADARAAGDLAAERLALAMTAEADIHAGRHEDARRALDRSLSIARVLQDKSTLTLALVNSGYAAMERGDLDEAHDLLERALAVAETLPSQVRLTGVLFLLAAVANVGGDHAHAEEIALRGLRIAREQGRWIERLELLTELAHARFAADPVEGALLLGAATAAYADRGLRRSPRATRRAGLLAEACRRSDDGAVRRALRDGELLSPAAAVDRALGAFSGRSAAAATVGRVS